MQISRINNFNQNSLQQKSMQNQERVENTKNSNVAFKQLLSLKISPAITESADVGALSKVLNTIKSNKSFQQLCQVANVKVHIPYLPEQFSCGDVNVNIFAAPLNNSRYLERAVHLGTSAFRPTFVDAFYYSSVLDPEYRHPKNINHALEMVNTQLQNKLTDDSINLIAKLGARQLKNAMWNNVAQERKSAMDNIISDFKNTFGVSDEVKAIE